MTRLYELFSGEMKMCISLYYMYIKLPVVPLLKITFSRMMHHHYLLIGIMHMNHSYEFLFSRLQRRNSMTSRSKKGVSQTKWYQDEEFNKSRNSLETDDNDDSEESYFNSEEELDMDASDGLISKLFPTKKENNPEAIKPYIRPRAETNDKLEKYKFMLINIEQDEDILDPGTFGLMEDSYLGFDFNDYPSEVLCPNPTQQQCQGIIYKSVI